MAEEISQPGEYQQANTPDVQSQLYNSHTHWDFYPLQLSRYLQTHHYHASIADAVQTLESAGLQPTMLPALLRPSCVEAWHVLISAMQNGFSLPPLQPPSSASTNVHRELSIRSHHSGMSGDTLYSPTNDADGAWKQSRCQAIPETLEEAISLNTLQIWHGEDSKQSPPRNFSYPAPTVNQPQPKLQTPFDDTIMTDQQASEISFCDMLQNDIPDHGSSPWHHSELPVEASQTDFVDPADTQDIPDPQWIPLAEEEDESFGCNSPSTPGVSVITTPRAPRSHQAPPLVIVGYTPKEEEKPGYRSPCPLCESDFVAPREMMSHTKAKHDQPIKFLCTHTATTKHGLERCPFTACVSNRFRKHHTETHRECPLLPQCVKEVHEPRPKRVWGCWFCTWVATSLEDWVKHHMHEHQGWSRKLMSHTWYIKSLLSQNAIEQSWQAVVKQLEEETGATWNITWYAGNDPTRDVIIQGLETGFWEDHDFHRNQDASRRLAAAALKATAHTRIKQRPLRDQEQKTTQQSSTRGSSPSRPRRQRSFPRLPSLRSRSIMRIPTTDAVGTIEEVPRVPSGVRDGHAQNRSTVYGASHEDQVHMYLF